MALFALLLGICISWPVHTADAETFMCADATCLIASMETAIVNSDDLDVIQLAAGTYTLTTAVNADFGQTGLPQIFNTGLIIKGAGRDQTIIERAADAPPFRIMTVVSSGFVFIENLTIRGGNILDEGGGIWNAGSLFTITNCHITGNAAVNGGGIYHAGARLTIANSVISGNMANEGAGIYNAGNLVMTDSTLSGNTAALRGGGMRNLGEAAIMRSTFNGNTSPSGEGGGLYLGGGTTIINTTVVNNQAAKGGGIYNGGEALFTHLTVADNTGAEQGGGIWNSGAMALQHVIIARNTGMTGPDCYGLGELYSTDHNLFGVTADCFNLALLPNDLTGEAGLGMFTDDGTPGRGHVPLLPDSPAIGKGNPTACPPVDQLGQSRHMRCDLGAVAGPPTP